MTSEALIHLVTGALIGAVGWLLSRSINRIDTKLDILHHTDKTQGEELVELRVRLAHAEAEVAAWRQWREDIGGFLAGLGFKKRDGPP
ncbi:MAG: hypothetical protein ACRD4T_00125 [Candidatus Acidiferrales bacterium]